MRAKSVSAIVAVFLAGCAGGRPATPASTAARPTDAGSPIPDVDAGTDVGPWHRDWSAHPPVVTASAPGELWALSDVHGGYDRAVTLLDNAGLAQVDASDNARWTGGNAILVVVGDLIDKGSQSVEVVDLFRELQADAPRTGGEVIVTLGNHEAEFLGNPEMPKAQALDDELATMNVTPEQFASTDTRWGRFLHELPMAALVSGWFFTHSGDAGGRTIAQLASQFQAAFEANDWSADVLVGATSPLEARRWYDDASLATDLAALGARHVVMGHDPHAFSEKGEIAAHFEGRLVHIDTGMSPAVDYSQGRLLEVVAPGTPQETASSVSHTGKRTTLDLSQP